MVLRFTERDYKDEASKWRVGSKGLSIILVILQHYTPSPDDFERKYLTQDGKQIPVSKPPGFELMYKLLSQDGEELRQKLMRIARLGLDALAEGERAASDIIELTVRRVYEITEWVLSRQLTFAQLNETSSSPRILSRLETYLMANRFVAQKKLTNDLSGKSVHLLIEPVLNQLPWLNITMISLNILYLLSQTEGLQSQIIALLRSYREADRMMDGICALLDLPPHADQILLTDDLSSATEGPETYVKSCSYH